MKLKKYVQNIMQKHQLKDECLYGVYGLTAAAVIKDWDILVTVYDIIWGGTVYFLTAYLTFVILSYI